MKRTALATFAILGVAVPIRAQMNAAAPSRQPLFPAVAAPASAPEDTAPKWESERPFETTPAQRRNEDKAAERKMDETIRAGIGYCRERGIARVEAKLRRLGAEGTPQEKAEYAAAVGKIYRFPTRIEAEHPSASFRMATNDVPCRAKRCINSGEEQVCNNRQICKMVCQGAAGGIGGAIGGGAGGAIGGIGSGGGCQQVCEYVPECRTVSVCYQYEWSGPGCF